jgi:hypothetical protein
MFILVATKTVPTPPTTYSQHLCIECEEGHFPVTDILVDFRKYSFFVQSSLKVYQRAFCF